MGCEIKRCQPVSSQCEVWRGWWCHGRGMAPLLTPAGWHSAHGQCPLSSTPPTSQLSCHLSQLHLSIIRNLLRHILNNLSSRHLHLCQTLSLFGATYSAIYSVLESVGILFWSKTTAQKGTMMKKASIPEQMRIRSKYD